MSNTICSVIDFAKTLFPILADVNVERLKIRLATYMPELDDNHFYLQDPVRSCIEDGRTRKLNIIQGDILLDIPFINLNGLGDALIYKAPGIVLANTCDAQNNESILIAPFRPLSDHPQYETIKKNRSFSYMYIPSNDPAIYNNFIDFNRTNSINLNVLNERIMNGKTTRPYSLTQEGYYVLLIKLSIYLHRPENSSVNICRQTCLA